MSTTSNVYNTQQQQQPGVVKQAYEGGVNLTTGAAETIKSSVTNDPTAQYRNHQPHVGGVGDLGTTSETDVVRLPEERSQDVKPMEPQTQSPGYMQQAYQGAASIATTAVNTISGALASAASAVPPAVKQRVVPDPTTHYRNKRPHVGGVGDLGTTSEVDVVRLPEERANPDPYHHTPIGVGDLGTKSEVDVVRLPEERANPDPLAAKPGGPTATERPRTNDWDDREGEPAHRSRTGHITGVVHDVTQPGHSGGLTGSNHDVDHGLGMPHREGLSATREQPMPIQTDVDKGTAGASDAGTHKPLASQGAKPATEGAPTSPSKMDKLKGKIMVAKGKLTKDEEEIAQGKRLMETGKAVDIDEILAE